MFNTLQNEVRYVPAVLCQLDSEKQVWQFVIMVWPLMSGNKAHADSDPEGSHCWSGLHLDVCDGVGLVV